MIRKGSEKDEGFSHWKIKTQKPFSLGRNGSWDIFRQFSSGSCQCWWNRGAIGTAGIGFFSKMRNYEQASIIELRSVIRKAREKSRGIIGVNIMVALTNFADMVKTSIEEGIDVIFSGAGLPLNLSSFLKEDSKTKLVPIISFVRVAKLIEKRWFSKYKYLSDAFVLEEPLAGGHLGYKKEEIFSEGRSLEKNVPVVKEYLLSLEMEYGKEVSLMAGGEHYSREYVQKMLGLGADAIQMGTRFIATEEYGSAQNSKC